MILANHIERIDNFVISTYNIFARIIFFFSIKKRSIVSKNRALKNKHKGERCFILLNGPSLKKYDLSLLKNEVTFACNHFYQSDFVGLIQPTYYCGLDPSLFRDGFCFEKLVFDKYPNCKIIENYKGYKNNSRYGDKCYYSYYYHLPTSFCVSHNFDSICSGFQNVSFFAINAAIYMGFKKIYLLGLDFEPASFTHFYDKNINYYFKEPKDYWQYTRAQYESVYLNKHAKKNGVSIYNLNANSYIRSFEFKEYKDIFNDNISS